VDLASVPRLTKLQSETHRADVIRRAVGLQIKLTIGNVLLTVRRVHVTSGLGSVLMTVRSGSGDDKPESS